MEIIGSVATKILNHAIDALFHQLGYLVYYKNNIKGLKEEAENLVSARSRVQHLIDEAKAKAENVEDDVQIWLTKVGEITEETYNFLINIVQEKEKKCMNGSCFNLVQRRRLSRKAKKMAIELANVQERGKFDKVSYLGSLPMFENIIGYVPFESRVLILQGIIEALVDPNINMIGVYGMGGIGKTTIVKDVSCQVMKSKLFQPVIMATIGQNPDVKLIQGQLADMLSLSFGQETEQGRAALLRKRLQMEKNILIVLDDLWNGLDLERVGIPEDNYKGCKILVTSRSEHVLSNKMNIEKNFEVNNLTEEESWSFFKNMIIGGSIEMTSQEWKDIAIQVANKCGKLPIALATVAEALRGKRLHAWKDALRQLNNPASVNIDGVSEEVYASLKLSYDYLNSPEAKFLFLLCSMFPDDYDINKDNLFKYAMGLKFLQGVDTLETARDRILTLVDNLECSCMLQRSEKGNEYVKMHDVVRDVAIHIASKNDQMCTLSYGKVLDMLRDEDTEGHYTALFLTNCVDFCDLPKKLRFPKLEVLVLMFDNWNDIQFSEEFFEGMEKLKVLHLKSMYFPTPPSSFNNLINLRTLLLNNCELENIDMIGEMKNLEILDLSESSIRNLPLGISQLSRLKELNLFSCLCLEVIPPQVISKLTKLEKLHISHKYGAWDRGEGSEKNASLVELQHLSRLATLYLCVPNCCQLPEKAFSNTLKLKEFAIIIGEEDGEYEKYRTKKALEINMNSRNVVLDEGVSMLVKSTEELVLTGEIGKKDALLELYGSDVLRFLDIEDGEDVEYLISEISHKPFPNLEYLSIKRMERLHTIVQGFVKTVKAFGNLKFLHVEYCNKLKYLFPFSIMKGLFHLEELIVEDCEIMEAIVVIENEIEKNIDKVEWSRLRSLNVRNLPQLKSFCCERLHTTQPMDDEIVEEDQIIANLMTPSDAQVVFPDLKWLEIVSVKNIQEDQLNANYKFSNLETITLTCENIKYIFTQNTLIMLEKLRSLDVAGCHSLEEVFNLNEDDISFSSNLEELILEDLPNLKQVWNVRDHGDEIQINFASLIKVEVKNCPKVKILFPTSLTKHLHQLTSITIQDCAVDEIFAQGEAEMDYSKVSFPKLQELRIERVNSLERIWPKRLIVDDLPKFQSIVLRECKNLKSVITLNVMKVLEELEELRISTCESLEEVFEIHQKLPQDQDQAVPIKLRKIKLCGLPSLKHVWWSKDFDGIFYSFQNLYKVEVTGCKKLQILFPPSIRTHFPHQLKTLTVDENGSDAIFMNNRDFMFEEGACIRQSEMELYCKKVKVARDLCHPKFSEEPFPAIEVRRMILNGSDDYKSVHFPLTLDPLLSSFETLIVRQAALVEIFSTDGVSGNEENQSRRSSASLKALFLTKLPKLMHIWKESPHTIQPIFDHLETVHVENCGKLNIFPKTSSLSFRNLKHLVINESHGLINVLDPCVAKTLVHLQSMSLSECKSMTLVLAEREDGKGDEDEIVFSELSHLYLHDLPELKGFQYEKCTIKFPKLQFLSIKRCPEMKMFSHGSVYTPLLESFRFCLFDVHIDIPETLLRNINDSIRQLWQKDDGYGHAIHNLFNEEEKVNAQNTEEV